MNLEQLRQLQAPLKQRYREEPGSAVVTMRASGEFLPGRVACQVQTDSGPVIAGLHPAAGGDGSEACSGDMLLQALVACSGVTLSAVALAMGIELRAAKIVADADMDFRGTLGIDKECPVGITALRLNFELQSSAEDSQLEKLVQLTERYCVVLQTLAASPTLTSKWFRV